MLLKPINSEKINKNKNVECITVAYNAQKYWTNLEANSHCLQTKTAI